MTTGESDPRNPLQMLMGTDDCPDSVELMIIVQEYDGFEHRRLVVVRCRSGQSFGPWVRAKR